MTEKELDASTEKMLAKFNKETDKMKQALERRSKLSEKERDEFWLRNFAATAMNAILLAPDTYGTETPESIANLSVGYAIAMMEEIKKIRNK